MTLSPAAEAPAECQRLVSSDAQGWVDARGAGQEPLWLRDPCARFWLGYQPDERLLYVQVNEVQNRRGETLEEFFDRGVAIANTEPVDRLVLDLRLNSGGDLFLLRPVMIDLIGLPLTQLRRRFFTIIGRRTFSAAQFWVDELERYTETVFVGEPTAQAVNFYSDPEVIVLPRGELSAADHASSSRIIPVLGCYG